MAINGSENSLTWLLGNNKDTFAPMESVLLIRASLGLIGWFHGTCIGDPRIFG